MVLFFGTNSAKQLLMHGGWTLILSLFRSSKNSLNLSVFDKSLDINNFEKLQKFPLNISSHSVKNIIKTEDSKINYTFSDLDAFDRIVKLNEGNTNDKSVKGNDKENNLKSNIDKKSIKIINFDRLKKRKKIDKKQRDKKIKVKYFD